jgi:sn-glycerol 3-phosphate transport system permease protein
MVFFWLIFLTLMLPVEVRIVPTYEVVAAFGMLNSYSGSDPPADRLGHGDLPVPAVLHDHPGRAGRGRARRRRRPMRFFFDILLPMSRTNIAALFVILFIYGWNQYLWPLLITTDPSEHHRHGHPADVPLRR